MSQQQRQSAMPAQMTSPVLKSASRLVGWMRVGCQIAAGRRLFSG